MIGILENVTQPCRGRGLDKQEGIMLIRIPNEANPDFRLEPADIILVSRNWRGWWREIGHLHSYYISRKIQRETLSMWNHVAIALSSERVIEATTAVEINPAEKYLADTQKYRIRVKRHKDMIDAERDAITRWARRREGEPYDWWCILRIKYYLERYGLREGIKLIKDKTPGVWICSEFCQKAYHRAGYEYANRILLPYEFDYLPGLLTVYDSEQAEVVRQCRDSLGVA